MEKITFRHFKAGFESHFDGKPVYPHKDMPVNDGESVLVELADRGRFWLATSFSPSNQWRETKKEIEALEMERDRVFSCLVQAYATAVTLLPPPPLPIGRQETKEEYSGGQGWDGLHGDTAEDGGDYVTRTYLYVSPQVYEDYMEGFKTWCAQIETICVKEVQEANEFLVRRAEAMAKAAAIKIDERYLSVYPRMLDFRSDCFSWCCGSMFGPLLDLPNGIHPLHRDGLTVRKDKNEN